MAGWQHCRDPTPPLKDAPSHLPFPGLQVGERVRAEGVPHNEGSYKWRVTRLELESAAAAAAAAPPPRTASIPGAAGGGAGGPGRYPVRSGAHLHIVVQLSLFNVV